MASKNPLRTRLTSFLSAFGFPIVYAVVAIVVALMLLSPAIAISAVAAAGLAGMFFLPSNALPAIAIWLLVLVPVGYMDVPRMIGRYASPAVLIIAIWLIRVAFEGRSNVAPKRTLRGWPIVLPFFALLAVSTLASGVDPARSIAWIAVFSICVVAPAMVAQTSLHDAWRTVRPTFAGIGLFLGILAAVEYFAHINPWTGLFRADVLQQEFSFIRAKTSLGHPLITSAVASVSLAVSVFPSHRGRQWPYWICAAGALVAVILSVSRGGAIALAFASIVGVLALFRGRSQLGGRKRHRTVSVVLAATFLVSIIWSPLLNARSQTSGARKSTEYRFEILSNTIAIVSDSPILGLGPGASDVVYIGMYGWSIESSALQLLLSVGIPAFLLFLFGLGAVVRIAIRRSRAGVAAGIVAFFAAISGYNAINSNPAMLALVAPLVFCAVAPSRAAEPKLQQHLMGSGVLNAVGSCDVEENLL